MKKEPFDRSNDPELEELVRLAEHASRNLGLSVTMLRFGLRREVLRRKSLRTAALAGLRSLEMKRILTERENEKDRKRCT